MMRTTLIERMRAPGTASRGGEGAQAMAETALLYALVIFGGTALVNWAPDTLNALNDYMMGIHYVVGTPLG